MPSLTTPLSFASGARDQAAELSGAHARASGVRASVWAPLRKMATALAADGSSSPAGAHGGVVRALAQTRAGADARDESAAGVLLEGLDDAAACAAALVEACDGHEEAALRVRAARLERDALQRSASEGSLHASERAFSLRAADKALVAVGASSSSRAPGDDPDLDARDAVDALGKGDRAAVERVFELFDTDSSGALSPLELAHGLEILGKPVTRDELDALLERAGKPPLAGNSAYAWERELSKDEFIALFAMLLREQKQGRGTGFADVGSALVGALDVARAHVYAGALSTKAAIHTALHSTKATAAEAASAAAFAAGLEAELGVISARFARDRAAFDADALVRDALARARDAELARCDVQRQELERISTELEA